MAPPLTIANIVCNYCDKLNHFSIHALLRLTLKEPKLNGYLTLLLELCSFLSLKANKSFEHWYLDSGCSNHITGNISYFKSLTRCDGGSVTLGNNGKVDIYEIGHKLFPTR